MAERLLNAGFWLCDFAYAFLESIQRRFLPDSIPRFTITSLRIPLQDLLPAIAIPDSDEFEALRVLIIGSSDGVTETIQTYMSDDLPMLQTGVPYSLRPRLEK